jgi:hypothetical protein
MYHMKKIALIGSAPSSVKRAPYGDKSWEIWGCSPGAIPFMTRIDRFFEMHGWRPENACCEANYVNRIKKLDCTIFMVNPVPELPQSRPYPKDMVLSWSYGMVRDHHGRERPAHFNPNDFGSTLSWMLAMAIIEVADDPEGGEIGLWGVDMAAGEEYGPQKDGCLALIHIAKSIGIKIVLPPESDLIRPAPLYGYQEHDHMYVKLAEREKELTARIQDAAHRRQAAHDEFTFLNGAIDDVRYMMKTWIADGQAIQMAYSQPEPIDVAFETAPKENGPAALPPAKAKRGWPKGRKRAKKAGTVAAELVAEAPKKRGWPKGKARKHFHKLPDAVKLQAALSA